MTLEEQAWRDGIKAREKGQVGNPHEGIDPILAQQWASGWLIADVLLHTKLDVAHAG